jgi:uncharacterized protein (TIGR00299 family) protein
MKTLHFDCAAGIAGDMVLGACVDLGVSPDAVRAELQKLGLKGWDLNFVRDERCGIYGTRAEVKVEDEQPHAHHSHHHHHWHDIRALIQDAPLNERVKERAVAIFTRIAQAEAQVHNVSVEEVAFHEVGALDSIIDIVGAAVCLDLLAPDRVTSSAVELGGGTVHCAHGVLPVPAPATLLLCKGLPVKTGGFQKEMTTPTGAAILASCVDEFIETAVFCELKSGYGLGTHKLDRPNLLRVSLREEQDKGGGSGGLWNTETLTVIETNVDDMTGEDFGFLMDCLFAAGALDVTFTPCTMKKSRPGVIISVLCSQGFLDTVRRTLFERSSSIGFREYLVTRHSLRREMRTQETECGTVRVKAVFLGDKELRSKVEYDDRSRTGKPVSE